MRDRRLLYTAAFVRVLATGFIGVLLGVYLAEIGLDVGTIGVVVSAGLAGAGMKIGYDLLLWRAFRHVKPPEELRGPGTG